MKIDLKDHLCFQLYVASRLIIQAYGDGLQHLGLTYLKYLVLSALVENEGQSVRELGQMLELDSGTLSPLLQSLERDKLITRRRSNKDQRVVINFASAKGRELQKSAQEIAIKLFSETGLSENEFVRLRSDVKDFVGRGRQILEKNTHINKSTNALSQSQLFQRENHV